MSRVSSFHCVDWTARGPAAEVNAPSRLERGDVLLLPSLRFEVGDGERSLFSPTILAAGKNISFDPSSGAIGGSSLTGAEATNLRAMLARFSDGAFALVRDLFPAYAARLRRARASFRPVEIAGRESSWRKDDTRLHIDAFPASPVQGQRILRVFTNVNPNGQPRSWRIGDDFEEVARCFSPRLRMPFPGTAAVLRLFRITRTVRSSYDALMLQLHDQMKADTDYQATAPQTAVDFDAGSTWIAFTDQVSHAAMSGQYQLEQTFLLPVDAMLEPHRSPLRILERLKGRPLV